MKKNVLLIRLDKIGDLICTLPADQVLDTRLFNMTWIIQKGLSMVIENGEVKRNFIELNKNDAKQSQLILRKFLAENHFDYAISFQCPWWVNYEIFRARIKNRIGVYSQWHSFLFLNKGLRQKRSLAQKHEFQYNLDLMAKITGPFSDEKYAEFSQQLLFKIKKPQSAEILQQFNLPSQYVVIHPGMMGSALNISQHDYIQTINHLIEEINHQQLTQTKKIVITGTDADSPYLNEIKNEWNKNTIWQQQVIWLQSKLSFSQLISVLHYSEYVIAPSTGVAHIAASLDKKVVGIYSPIRVHHPMRWAPRGVNAATLVPENVKCPEAFHCRGKACPEFNCMDKILPQIVSCKF